MILALLIALAAPEQAFGPMLRDALAERAKDLPFDYASDVFAEWKKQHDLKEAAYRRCVTLRAVDRMVPRPGQPERTCVPPDW